MEVGILIVMQKSLNDLRNPGEGSELEEKDKLFNQGLWTIQVETLNN
jgi:hypothetical protein